MYHLTAFCMHFVRADFLQKLLFPAVFCVFYLPISFQQFSDAATALFILAAVLCNSAEGFITIVFFTIDLLGGSVSCPLYNWPSNKKCF